MGEGSMTVRHGFRLEFYKGLGFRVEDLGS